MIKSEYTYRLARHSDLQQLQALGVIAYGQFRAILSAENWNAWLDGLTDDTNFSNLLNIAKCFVCETGGEIVGMAFLVPSGNPFLHFQEDWSYIRYVGVHPEHEGKGIGKSLTKYCIAGAQSAGEKTIALHTSAFQDAARHIYESLGFEKQMEFLVFDKTYWIYTLALNER